MNKFDFDQNADPEAGLNSPAQINVRAAAPAGKLHTAHFLVGGFSLLVLVVLMLGCFAQLQRYEARQVQSTLVSTQQLSNILSTTRQALNGDRNYLLLGTPDSLSPFELATGDLPGELDALQVSLRAGPHAAAFNNIKNLVDQLISVLTQNIALCQSGDRTDAVSRAALQKSFDTQTKIRLAITPVIDDLTRKLDELQARDAHYAMLFQLATLALFLGIVLLAFFAVRENNARAQQLRAAELALIQANQALEQKVEQRTRTLRASETQFRGLAESMPGFAFTTTAEGGNAYVNPQFIQYTGLSAERIVQDGWLQVLHPDDLASTLTIWTRCLAEGTQFETEYRFRRHDGVYRWFLGRSAPVRDESGAISGWIGTATDIEDRKRAEAELLDTNFLLEQRVTERSRELDRIFRLSADLLAVANFDGGFRNVSPAWEHITGWPIQDALSRPFTDFVHPEDLEASREVYARLAGGDPVLNFENRYRRADGGYCWLSWRAVPMLDESLAYLIARDVTQDKIREEQFRQSQKMEIVGQLTGGIAHDFNNLLTIILGSLELLQRNLGNAEPKILRRVDSAMEGARRAASLTHRLLAFSRRQPLAPKPIEVNRLLGGMSDMLFRTLGEAVAIELVAGAGLWSAMADDNQLENAILNLAVNARDAMPNGGHLTIETQNTYLDETYAARADAAPGQYVQISVTDTGGGMTPDVREKVFEPFFTTKPQGQGTGLGLAQVYGFIKQSGGHIAIYSEPGHGTTVKLYLPRMHGPGAADVAGIETLPDAALCSTGETILLVEDEEGVRNFAVEILEELGYHVLSAENALAALKILETGAGIDLLFTDVVLTGNMNGRVLANEILRQAPGTPVLFTTGYTRNAIIHHGRLDEGVNFIGKPFTASALASTIRRLLDGSRKG